MKHLKYAKHYEVEQARRIRRAEAALDFLTIILIGVGMATLLVAWWSS